MHLQSWNRFVLRAFAVAPSLLGATHTWQMDGAAIELRLPGAEKIERDRTVDDPVGRLSSWQVGGNPLEYNIYQVDVRVFVDEHVQLPPELLTRNPNAYDLIPQAQQDQLEAVAVRHRAMAAKAYEYWTSVIRWVCDDYRIGRPDLVGNESGWSTYLCERSSDAPVWVASTDIIITGLHRVGAEVWQSAQERLSQGAEMPIYLAQRQDAEALFAQQDYRRCTIDLCIAAETFLRDKVWASLPSTLADDVRSYVEQASIHNYINKFFPALLDEEHRASYTSEVRNGLRGLFESRNKIMHAGARDLANHEICVAHLRAVRALFALGL